MNNKRDKGSFDQRLQQARDKQGLVDPGQVPQGDKTPDGAIGMGARVGVEMASALVVGLVIGLWLDRWLHTKPWFMLLFLFLGMAAGVMNVWRLVSPRKPPTR